jgi:glycosyltransferase involved in cell wall biosynthesis
MMEVAWIISGFPAHEKDYGGAAAIHNLARELSQHPDIKLTIFSLYYPADRKEYQFYGAKVYSFGKSNHSSKIQKLLIWRNCRRKFAELHSHRKFDFIHSFWANEPGFVASRISREHGIPLIVNICGGELAEFPEIGCGNRLKFWQKRFVDRSFKWATRIVGGSDYILGKLKEYYPESIAKSVKIPFGVDENLFNASARGLAPLSRNPDGFTAINIASAVPIKSHDTLFKAIRIVSEKFPDVSLKVYGHDYSGELEKLSHELRVSENVKIMGFIEYEKISEAIQEADLYVCSSLYESQNMAMLEAAMCGVPVVSTNAGAASEITEHLIEPGNHRQLGEKTMFVLENLKREKEIAAIKINKVREEFSLSASLKGFMDLYNEILS